MHTNKITDSGKKIDIQQKVQKILARWIFSQGSVSWTRIRKACKSIILSLPQDEQSILNQRYPEYAIFIPLLRNGTAEVCRSEDRATLQYCMNPYVDIQIDTHKYVRKKPYFTIYSTGEDAVSSSECKAAFSLLEFLKAYAPIQIQIDTFAEQQIKKELFKVYMNLSDYHFEPLKAVSSETGIYKTDDIVWYPPYLLDSEKKIRRIPAVEENPDSINIARLYIRMTNPTFKKPIFRYNQKEQELTCYHYSELPILLSRALLLLHPDNLLKKEFCKPFPTIPFKNVTQNEIWELERIFSVNSIQTI